MNIKHSDLIAIANAGLADKLNRRFEIVENDDPNPEKDLTNSFKQDTWKAVYVLNIIRYALGIGFLALIAAPGNYTKWSFVEQINQPTMFFLVTILILLSAVLFSYVSKYKEVEFNVLVSAQFSLDVVFAAVLTHSTGSIESSFALLYVVVVATGSVVLPRKEALGLAGGAIILLFFEHFYSIWSSHVSVEPNLILLAKYGLALFASGLLISYLAERIRIAEMRKFVPGDESIEEFLVREEINALTAAMERTSGNKTEAAKLLGMSFRSFRYKLSKYDMS